MNTIILFVCSDELAPKLTFLVVLRIEITTLIRRRERWAIQRGSSGRQEFFVQKYYYNIIITNDIDLIYFEKVFGGYCNTVSFTEKNTIALVLFCTFNYLIVQQCIKRWAHLTTLVVLPTRYLKLTIPR